MIKRLKLRNFKSIEEVDLEFRPLTVLCGPNSVGKSSIGQALLLLKQSQNQFGSISMLHPIGELVNIGGFPIFIHKHELSKLYYFKIELDVENEEAQTQSPKSVLNEIPSEIRKFFENLGKIKTLVFEFSFKYDNRKEQILTDSFSIKSDNNTFHIESKHNDDGTYRIVYKIGEKEKKSNYCNTQMESLTGFLGFPLRIDMKLKTIISNYKREKLIFVTFITYVLLSFLKREISLLNYLGPFRQPPERTYQTGGAKPEGIGTRGQLTIDYLTYSSISEEDGSVKFANKWLNRFGYASDFKINKVHDLIYTTNLKNKNTGVESTLLDVGFGISQVLPVIVSVYLHSHGLHIFEQPEIHLHPASQADLADLFMETITEDKQYLVETHSEHFLNRIRTRIAQGRIDPDKVVVYYMNYKGTKLEISPIFINENGSFKDIPTDFFGEALSETKAIMEARKQRKLL